MLISLSYLLIIASLILLLYRIIKGPGWSDRILAADLMGVYLIAGLLILQLEFKWEWDRDVVWVVLLLGFVTIFGSSFLLFSQVEEPSPPRKQGGQRD